MASEIYENVEFVDGEGEAIEPVCAWFANCERPAVNVIMHPALGGVPTCEPCTAFVQAA